jgi:hypothetical protein
MKRFILIILIIICCKNLFPQNPSNIPAPFPIYTKGTAILNMEIRAGAAQDVYVTNDTRLMLSLNPEFGGFIINKLFLGLNYTAQQTVAFQYPKYNLYKHGAEMFCKYYFYNTKYLGFFIGAGYHYGQLYGTGGESDEFINVRGYYSYFRPSTGIYIRFKKHPKLLLEFCFKYQKNLDTKLLKDSRMNLYGGIGYCLPSFFSKNNKKYKGITE